MAELTLEEAYRKWSEDLGRYATVLVGPSAAADIVADAIVSVMTSGRWHEVSNHKSYLLTAVLNSARMAARADSRRSRREVRAAMARDASGTRPEHRRATGAGGTLTTTARNRSPGVLGRSDSCGHRGNPWDERRRGSTTACACPSKVEKGAGK